jgi:SAM-dependent methyltransferase
MARSRTARTGTGAMSATSDSPESRRRKESFDLAADLYDRFRPAPPPGVVDAVIASARLRPGSRALEIGCGTGQLSVALAAHGVDLTAIELGPNLAALAARNLAPFANARVEAAPFEEWPLPARAFDAVVCANAFHWLDPEIRFAKCADALRPGGRLVILHTHHVAGGTERFFVDAQPIYWKWGLSDDPSFRHPAPDEIADSYPELDRQPQFDGVVRQRLEIPMRHTGATYVGWLRTDSLVNTLGDAARQGFLDDIGDLISSEYRGSVARNFVYEVIVATRLEHDCPPDQLAH